MAPNNYNVLADRTDLQHIGGAEVQRALIARELVRRGYEVSFVTWDHGQPDGIAHDGIRVFKMCEATAGLPGLRFLHPRWSSLWAAMARADADLYYQRTAGVESGQVALWCRARGRRFVYGLASDAECDRRSLRRRPPRERWFYLYALRAADAIIAQTNAQRALVAAQFGREAYVIRSCALEPRAGASGPGTPERLGARRVLWVGRAAYPKRPEMLEDLARLAPDLTFDVVGIPGGSAADDEVTRRLEQAPNVVLHGFVPHREVGVSYDRAAILLCTSRWEGFPNTFIEAWSRGVPTVSTVDPDDLIKIHGLGAVAACPEDLVGAVRALLDSPQRWTECSERTRAHFRAMHTVPAAGDAYEALLGRLLPNRRAASRDRRSASSATGADSVQP